MPSNRSPRALMDLSVVVPVRNEAENIIPLIEEIHAALDGVAEFEVIYVDDGSDDDTPARLREAAERFPRLRVLHHDRACGQSRAVSTGVTVARAPFIVTMDGDGQNDPASVPDMWARMTADGRPDPELVVCGYRRNRKDTGIRRIASRVANVIRSRLLHDDTPDSGCGLKVFSRERFLDLPRFDHMHRFLPALFIQRGCTVVSVEVNHRPRQRGTSKYGILDRAWVGLWDLMGVMWLMRRTKHPAITED